MTAQVEKQKAFSRPVGLFQDRDKTNFHKIKATSRLVVNGSRSLDLMVTDTG